MHVLRKEFLRLLTSASDQALMMSRKNCHTPDVSSIVLKNEGGRLTRMFLAWPRHRLWMNAATTEEFEVGVHNHLYDISITPFFGHVFNELYEEGGRNTFDYYEFRSGVKGGEFKTEKLGGRFLRYCGTQNLCSGDFLGRKIFMRAAELHTISALPGHAAWLIEEGETTRSWTSLYTNVPVKQKPGMYGKFESPDAVRDHCIKFLVDLMKPRCHDEKHPSLTVYEGWTKRR